MSPNWGDLTFEFCMTGALGSFNSDYLVKVQFPFIFLDIGANQGLYSLISARNENCRSVIAIEPVHSIFRLLCKNIRLNKDRHKILPFKAAVSSEMGQSNIYTVKGHSGVASLHSQWNPPQIAVKVEQIDTITAKEMEEIVPGDLPIIVKIDTEGYEEEVFRQLYKCSFFGRVNAILYELSPQWIVEKDIEAELRRYGFTQFTSSDHRQGYDGEQWEALASRI